MRTLQFAIPCLFACTIESAVPDVPDTLQNILKNTDNSDKYKYPTDLTRGIVPKPFHSHNDYWRDVPFYSGLSYGAVSTEADVWLINGTLFVGHELSALTPERTLESLYILPILDTLSRQNPVTKFSPSPTFHGVFDTDSEQTLCNIYTLNLQATPYFKPTNFFIDLKTPGPETWAAVLSALQPLRSAQYLSTSDGSKFTTRPVTVIGTGNTPLSVVEYMIPRYAFYDAPLPLLATTFSNITAQISPIASTNFADVFGDVRTGLTDAQMVVLAAQIKVAQDKGIKVRYWNQPAWPVGTRNRVWKQLWEGGVDFLNVDDLEGAAGFWEGT